MDIEMKSSCSVRSNLVSYGMNLRVEEVQVGSQSQQQGFKVEIWDGFSHDDLMLSNISYLHRVEV